MWFASVAFAFSLHSFGRAGFVFDEVEEEQSRPEGAEKSGTKKTLHQQGAVQTKTTGHSSGKTPSNSKLVRKHSRTPRSVRKLGAKDSPKHAPGDDQPTKEGSREQRESEQEISHSDDARSDAGVEPKPTPKEAQEMDQVPMPVNQPKGTRPEKHDGPPLPLPSTAPKQKPQHAGFFRRVAETSQRQDAVESVKDDTLKTEGRDANPKSPVPLAPVTIVTQQRRGARDDYYESTTLSFFKAVPELEGHDYQEIVVNEIVPSQQRVDYHVFSRNVVRRQGDYGSTTFFAPTQRKREDYAKPKEESFLGYEVDTDDYTGAVASEKPAMEQFHSGGGDFRALARGAHGAIASAKLSLKTKDYSDHDTSSARSDDYGMLKHFVADGFSGVVDGDYDANLVDTAVYSTVVAPEAGDAFSKVARIRYEKDYE